MMHPLETSAQDVSNSDSSYLKTVKTFADNVLRYGKDTYGPDHSPLLADGINVRTKEPVRWEFEENSWIISNFASQQNLMRVLTGLTALTGDPKYRKAAEETVSYMFEKESDTNGLLRWGGHQFVDLQTQEPKFDDRPHELKSHFPYYELMWEVDSSSTRKMIEAMWNAHVLDWEVLDLNRHGEYNKEMGELWSHQFKQAKPFFQGSGLTFINAGTDLVDAALFLYRKTGSEGPGTWGLRLYEQYVRARNEKTGLGVYQYSQPVQLEEPPKDTPLTGELTFSRYGDRAKNQFGEKYGDIALEGNVLWGGRVRTLYGQSSFMLLHQSEQIGDIKMASKIREWVLSGLRSYAETGYDPERNVFKPMWSDGTDLSGEVYPRTGYYGRMGTPFRDIEPDGTMFLAYIKAASLTGGEDVFWNVVRNIMIDWKLGDVGDTIRAEPELNMETEISDATILTAILDLYEITANKEFLKQAEVIGNNIINAHFHDGFFRPTTDHIYTKFDSPEPLVLLMLEAAKQGRPEAVDRYLTGSGSTDGEPNVTGPPGRPSDDYFYRETYSGGKSN